MYRQITMGKGRIFTSSSCDIQKSVKLDRYAYDIISSCSGRSFSDKVRNLAYEYSNLKEESGNK